MLLPRKPLPSARRGVDFLQHADENTTGPASFVAVDPDENPIPVDQHV
jgi:lactoylglutathione lyase